MISRLHLKNFIAFADLCINFSPGKEETKGGFASAAAAGAFFALCLVCLVDLVVFASAAGLATGADWVAAGASAANTPNARNGKSLAPTRTRASPAPA